MKNSLTGNLMTTKEAAKLSGYTPDYLARLVRSGKLVGEKKGNSWLIERESLARLLDKKGDEKTTRTSALSKRRIQEYHKHQQPMSRVSIMLTKARVPAPLPKQQSELVDTSYRAHVRALAVACAVVVIGLIGSHTDFIPDLAHNTALIAQEVSIGFDAAFGDIPMQAVSRIADANILLQEKASIATPATFAMMPLSAQIDLSNQKAFLAREYHSPQRFFSASSASALAQHAVSNAGADRELTLITIVSASLQHMVMDLYHALKTTPQLVIQADRVFGQALIDATHTVIRAEVALIYETVLFAPRAAETIFDVGHSAAERFVSLVQAVSVRYLALVDTVGHLVYQSTDGAISLASHSQAFVIPQIAAAFAGVSSFVAGEVRVEK